MKTHCTPPTWLAKGAVLFVMLCSFSSCQSYIDQLLDEIKDKKDPKDLPQQITIQEPSLFPEGIEYDTENERYLVSSLTKGTIGQVDDKGNYKAFIEDEDFVSTIGIDVDDFRKRLLVCVSDANERDLAALGIYDLRSGSRVSFTNLGDVSDDPEASHFANDVAVDLQGNAYVTDSFYPVIYKVDKEGKASVFLQDDTFQPSEGAFGLNGIVFHPAGFLIAAFAETNTLYKIPLDDPEAFSAITLDASLQGPDGLYLSNNLQTLLVVSNNGGMEDGNVKAFESEDFWETAELESTFKTGAVFPTTVAQRGSAFYVLYAHLNELFTGNTSRDTFEITQVDFE